MNRLGQLHRMRSITSKVIGAGCGAEPAEDETARFLFTLPPSVLTPAFLEENLMTYVNPQCRPIGGLLTHHLTRR